VQHLSNDSEAARVEFVGWIRIYTGISVTASNELSYGVTHYKKLDDCVCFRITTFSAELRHRGYHRTNSTSTTRKILLDGIIRNHIHVNGRNHFTHKRPSI
jgi:hypothetical protein